MRKKEIIRWVIIAFIALAIFNARHAKVKEWAISTGEFLRNFIPTEESTTTPEPSTASASEIAKPSYVITSIDDSFVSSFTAKVINKFFDTPNGKIILEQALRKSQDIENKNFKKNHIFVDKSLGTGSRRAQCGDTVLVSYNLFTNQQIDQNRITQELKIGTGAAPAELEHAMIGMHHSGVRDVYLEQPNQEHTPIDKKKYSTSTIEMLKLPELQGESNLRIFIDDSPTKLSNYIRCGNNIKLNYKLHDIHGKLLNEDSIAINFTELNHLTQTVYNNLIDKNLINLKATILMSYNDATLLLPTISKQALVKDPNEMIILDLYGPKV